MLKRRFSVLLLALAALAACASTPELPGSPVPTPAPEAAATLPPIPTPEPTPTPDPVEERLKALSEEEKVGQLLVTALPGTEAGAQAETAILVGLITQTQNERKTNEYLDELEFLAHTAGAVTVKRFTQKVGGPNSVTYVGTGKLEEIRAYIEAEEEAEREIGMVIFDDELSAKQLRNIEKELKVKILDRTSLILDIFAMRAQTANAKTQVELAQYRYMLPRLQRLWTHLERQGGGSGSGGG